MFQKLVLVLAFFSISYISTAQNAVNWSFDVTTIEEDSAIYLVEFHATITEKWHLYSQHLPSPDEGPLPTVFEIDENTNIELIGNVEEEKDKVHSVMDEAFEVQVNYFDGKVVFTQKIRLKSSNKTTLSGFISYMACSDEMCVPYDLDFTIPIGK